MKAVCIKVAKCSIIFYSIGHQFLVFYWLRKNLLIILYFHPIGLPIKPFWFHSPKRNIRLELKCYFSRKVFSRSRTAFWPILWFFFVFFVPQKPQENLSTASLSYWSCRSIIKKVLTIQSSPSVSESSDDSLVSSSLWQLLSDGQSSTISQSTLSGMTVKLISSSSSVVCLSLMAWLSL